MTELTYNRPYQYVEDLRLFGCYRSKEHTVFVGQGFADNAIAFVENNGMLTQLEGSGKVQHGDYDQLVTQRFDVDMPFRIYVVNPDDENGKASNAIEYTPTKDIPIVDVLVDGKSVVKDQKAYIDISKKLDSIMKPNMLYGTDSDGKETQYPRKQIEGVQHFFLNGDEIPLDMGNIRITDIARESKSVQRVNEPLQLYGTNEQGAQATYPKSFFATSESVINAAKDIQNLKENKQDKDNAAKDGYIAIMKGGQSIGSNASLDETLKKISDIAQELTDLTDNVKKISVKDWKSKEKDSRIENNPVGDNSIIISDKSIDDEKPFRETDHAIVYGLNPQSVGQYGTMVGSGNQTGQYGTTVGSFSSAKGDSATAIGTQSQSDGSHASALGVFANAQKTNSIAIGKGALSSADNATALGADSVADVDNTVSIGFETSDSQLKPQYRRLMAVDDPILDHDAVNKKYVDSKSSDFDDAFSPISNPYFLPSKGNVDKWSFLINDSPSSLIKFVNLNDVATSYGITTPSDWDKNLFGAVDMPLYKDGKKVRMVSRNLNMLNHDSYDFIVAVGGSTAIPSTVKIVFSLVFNNDFNNKLEVASFTGDQIKGGFQWISTKISVDKLFNIKDWTAPISKSLDVVAIDTSGSFPIGSHILITNLFLRNSTSQSTSAPVEVKSPYLDTETPVNNRYCIVDWGNLDGWMETFGGSTDWSAPQFTNILPSGFTAPDLKNIAFMKLSKRECVSKPVHVDSYDTYSFSCLAAVDSTFISQSKSFSIGYTVDVYPSSNNNSIWKEVTTVKSSDFGGAGNFIPVRGMFTLPPFANGYVNFRLRFFVNPGNGGVYLTDINVRKVSNVSERVSIKMPYLVKPSAVLTRVGAFMHLQIDGKSIDGTAHQVPEEKCNETVPYGYRPGNGFEGTVTMVSNDGYSMSVTIMPSGEMYCSGQYRPNIKYVGSAVYPLVDAYGQPNPM